MVHARHNGCVMFGQEHHRTSCFPWSETPATRPNPATQKQVGDILSSHFMICHRPRTSSCHKEQRGETEYELSLACMTTYAYGDIVTKTTQCLHKKQLTTMWRSTGADNQHSAWPHRGTPHTQTTGKGATAMSRINSQPALASSHTTWFNFYRYCKGKIPGPLDRGLQRAPPLPIGTWFTPYSQAHLLLTSAATFCATSASSEMSAPNQWVSMLPDGSCSAKSTRDRVLAAESLRPSGMTDLEIKSKTLSTMDGSHDVTSSMVPDG